MNQIQAYLEARNPDGKNETINTLKEMLQEIMLFSLSQTDFFDHAVFYGGTALRIFHGLDRFSEDMDFSLREKSLSFDLERYMDAVRITLLSFGLEADIAMKKKRKLSPIQSAFLKSNTATHLVQISAPTGIIQATPSNELIKIKLEIDTDPPQGAEYEQKFHLFPQPFEIALYDIPSLFAGKIHALLCRGWKSRVKGRDFYDYLWYLSHRHRVNLNHLEQRMRQSGHWQGEHNLTLTTLQDLLTQRFEEVDLEDAKRDISPFISSSQALDIWSREFFIAITKDSLRSS